MNPYPPPPAFTPPNPYPPNLYNSHSGTQFPPPIPPPANPGLGSRAGLSPTPPNNFTKLNLPAGDTEIYRDEITGRSLIIAYASKYKKLWDDRSTGANPFDVGIWRPLPPLADYYSLGELAERSPEGFYSGVPANPNGKAIVVREIEPKNPSPHDVPLLAHPFDFVQVWSDKGSGGTFGNCSVWEAVAPADYEALGVVVMTSHDTRPPLTSLVCVHHRALVPGKVADLTKSADNIKGGPTDADPGFLWCLKPSGLFKRAKEVSFWSIDALPESKDFCVVPKTFVASQSPRRPSCKVWCLKKNVF